jgi:hypothetical protein
MEQLLEADMQVYPLNPKSAQAYREPKAPSGVKDDQLDAWCFASWVFLRLYSEIGSEDVHRNPDGEGERQEGGDPVGFHC